MRYLALASDYDGTLARHGVVDEQTVPALERLAQSGRKIVLVTGRELPDLESVLDRFDLFARIVAENGAVLSQRSAAPSRQNSVLSRMLNASVDHPHAFWTPPLHLDRPIARDPPSNENRAESKGGRRGCSLNQSQQSLSRLGI